MNHGQATSPFSQEVLNKIFTVSDRYPDRLISRESSWLEFKEAFNFTSLGKYLRTAAAFANAKGGYIVYGVKNNPHVMVGEEGLLRELRRPLVVCLRGPFCEACRAEWLSGTVVNFKLESQTRLLNIWFQGNKGKTVLRKSPSLLCIDFYKLS